MLRYAIASILSGVLFGLMDGIINANPIAKKLYAIYEPISKTSINVLAGLIIDLAYGFLIAGIFLVLYKSLPGKSWFVKGISFSILMWFFRVIMHVVSQWMMFRIPIPALLYMLGTGFLEMIILGLVYSITLRR